MPTCDHTLSPPCGNHGGAPGACPHLIHLDTTRVHGDGRDHSDAAPAAQVMPLTRGYRRDHRPDFQQVLLVRMGEHQAGILLLMTPRRGYSRATPGVGEAVRRHVP
jgi:hypothetical protein